MIYSDRPASEPWAVPVAADIGNPESVIQKGLAQDIRDGSPFVSAPCMQMGFSFDMRPSGKGYLKSHGVLPDQS